MKTRRVWAIYYKVRMNSEDSWNRHEWIGPCGVGVTGRNLILFITDCLSGRPFFFRTRALARQKAKELNLKRNISWNWIKHTVRPINLSWEELK